MKTKVNTKQIGFTLIELLVTIVIIGIILSFVVVAFGDFGRSRQVLMQQNHLADLMRLAKLRAIIESKTYGLNINKKKYTFYQFNYEQDSPYGHWSQLKDNLFKSSLLPNYKTMKYNHPLKPSNPQIIFSEEGKITPFTLTLTTENKESIELTVNVDGQIKISNKEQV